MSINYVFHCPYCFAPCPIIQRPTRIWKKKKKKLFTNCNCYFVFSDRDVNMLVKCLQICAHVFIDRPQNCAQTSFRSCAGLRLNFGHSRSKLCPILCRSLTKLCPNFGFSRARLCPISFAPCPFPNLAGTLITMSMTMAMLIASWLTLFMTWPRTVRGMPIAQLGMFMGHGHGHGHTNHVHGMIMSMELS